CFTYQPVETRISTTCAATVDTFLRGSWDSTAGDGMWLEGYVTVGQMDGTVVNVGMVVDSFNLSTGITGQSYLLGSEVEEGYWRTGFTAEDSARNVQHDVRGVAFFVDVRGSDDYVVRNVLANTSTNEAFTLESIFAADPYR